MARRRSSHLITTETPTTLGELLRRYSATAEAQDAAFSTKVVRARSFDCAIRRFGGTLKLREMEERGFRTRLYDWRDSLAATPGAARQHLRHLCAVFNWAVDRGIMRDNPAAAMRHTRSASRAEITWSAADIAAFRKTASPQIRDAFDLALWTGLRVGDVRELRAFQFDEGWLTVIPQKTRRLGTRLFFPYHLLPPLGAVVIRLFSAERQAHANVLRNLEGLPWGKRAFEYQVQATMVRAGIQGLHFHDLRGTLITMLLEAGCTEAEVGSISGHGIARGNMRSYAARTRPLAESAYRKLAAYLEKGNETKTVE